VTNFRRLNLRYDAEEDRILLSVQDGTGTDHDIWLTRRLVRQFFPALAKCLTEMSATAGRVGAQWRNEVLSFEHEKAVSDALSSGRARPAERAPAPEADDHGDAADRKGLLVQTIGVRKRSEGRLGLSFRSQDAAVDLELDDERLHVICDLLAKLACRAEWDLGLALPWQAPSRPEITAGEVKPS